MIISIGEVVWDIFPDGRQVLGGAPVNVAYHLRCLDLDVGIITRVGTDSLGEKTITRIASMGLSPGGIQKGGLPTGRANIWVNENNEPRFNIVTPAAWDGIDENEAASFVDEKEFDLVFGTLAQRNPRSRSAIRALWGKAGRRFYDVNLRPPHTTRELVLASLKVSDLVKVNNDELREIALWHKIADRTDRQIAEELLRLNGISVLAVTQGSDGAWLVTRDEYVEFPGEQVAVADTVGAGDAFFGALIEGYVTGRSLEESLMRANRRGAYVASRHGATPPMEGVSP